MGHGGLPKTVLDPLTRVMQRTEKAYLPVPSKRFTGSKLIAHLPGDPTWQIVNNPETPAGWQRPYCPWRIEPATDSTLEPLLTLESEGVKHLVGACTADHRMALLPIYAMTPCLLSGESRITSPSEPELDEASTKVLLGVVEKMMK
jgi:hypothetical protein